MWRTWKDLPAKRIGRNAGKTGLLLQDRGFYYKPRRTGTLIDNNGPVLKVPTGKSDCKEGDKTKHCYCPSVGQQTTSCGKKITNLTPISP